MAVVRLNHAVLYVRDAQASAAFYAEVLGLLPVAQLAGGKAVFLRAEGSDNDHDLALFSLGEDAGPSGAGQGSVGLYHLAWEVATLGELAEVRRRLDGVGALVGASDHVVSKSLYARDPDGIEFEVSWLVPADLLDDEVVAARSTIKPLDIPREKARYGGTRLGGVGVSRPVVPA